MSHVFSRTVAASLCLAGAALATQAQAQMLVGITSSNEIARFSVSDPMNATRTAITGLAAGDRFVGIDLRPSNNTLYGITLSNRIYTVNELTGQASFVAQLANPVVGAGLGWGIDFNPVADYGGQTSLRLVSSAGANYAVNVDSGAVVTATSIASGFSGAAYTNSAPNGMAPASTGLYYINSMSDTLAFTPTGFNNPVISSIGPLGVDVLNANGFEILPDGMAYAALNFDAGAALVTGLFAINLMTGSASMVGEFNGTLSGLTVSAIPEPGTYALMALGLGVVGFLARRRRQDGNA